jgi:phosphoinositide-3-kinase regulatory subunit 4
MTETVEDQLVIMKPHLVKINKYRNSMDTKFQLTPSDGKLELGLIKHKISHHVVILYPDTKGDIGLPSFKKLDRRISESTTTYASMNQEWRTMFAAHDNMQVIFNFIKKDIFHYICTV